MVRIVIPHQGLLETDINTAPYHRWEHLFVDMLQKDPGIYSARGMTTAENTELYVELNNEQSDTIDRCVSRIQYCKPSAKEFIIEGMIIDNELQCMEMVYRKKMGSCEKGSKLSEKEMYAFRHARYLWKDVRVIREDSDDTMYVYQNDNEHSQDRIALIRSRMMNCFRNIAISSIGKRDGNGFVLYRIPIMEGLFTPDQCKGIIDFLDTPKGFLWSRLNKKHAFSFLFWPSQEENDFNGFQLFTFVKVQRAAALWNALTDYILSLPLWADTDKELLTSYFSSPMVMICAI